MCRYLGPGVKKETRATVNIGPTVAFPDVDDEICFSQAGKEFGIAAQHLLRTRHRTDLDVSGNRGGVRTNICTKGRKVDCHPHALCGAFDDGDVRPGQSVDTQIAVPERVPGQCDV